MISLSRVLTAVTVFVIVALLINLSFTMTLALQGFQAARQNRLAVSYYEAIFHAANRISAERGPANVLMSIAAGSDPVAVGRLSLSRSESDRALAAVEADASRDSGAWARDIAAVRTALEAARGLVDQVAALPLQDRTLEMTIGASAAMMVAVDRIQPIILRQKYALLESDGSLAGPLGLAHAASDLREFAGRIGSYIIPFVVKDAPISDDRLQLIQETRGRILQLLSFMPREMGDASHEAFSIALRDIDALYLGRGLPLMQRLTEEGRQGLGYSIRAEDVTKDYVPTMAPLEALRKLVIAGMVGQFEIQQSRASSTLIGSVAVAAATTAAVLGLLFLLRRLTVRSLLDARRAIIDLSHDQFGPIGSGPAAIAELSSLFRALAVLRERLLERHALIDRLRLRTETDPLTGLMSRAHFEHRVQEAVERAGPGTFGILYVDIDHFKSVNDRLGHQVGDALLAEIGGRFRLLASDSVLIGRIGGDEFAVACLDATPRQREALAGNIIAAVGGIQQIDGLALTVSASIGLSVGSPGVNRYSELCRQADVALYSSKTGGRNRATWYQPHQALDAPGQVFARGDLAEALERGQFSLVFQPILDLGAGRVVAQEALARWAHPGSGNIPPAAFIPALEAAGMIGDFGEWVLREACRAAVSWPDQMAVSVNVSPRQLDIEGFPRAVARMLGETGLPPGRLHLEITECLQVDDDAGRVARLDHLRRLGVRIVLDDVGTGYAGLSAIQTVAFDSLKIDRRFIAAIGTCQRSEAILLSLLALVNHLGLSTVAEGVETQEQLDWLTSHGCGMAQGYLLGRPASAPAPVRPQAPAILEMSAGGR